VLLRTQAELRYSLHPRFHLEMGLMKLVHARKLVAIESVLAALESGVRPARPATDGPSTTSNSGTPRVSSGGPRPRPAAATPRAPGTAAVRAVADSPTAPKTPEPSSRAVATAAAQAPTTPGDEEESNAASGFGPAGSDARLEAIKAELFSQSKFLGSCLNPLAGWRCGNGEIQLIFSRAGAWAADLIRSQEHLDKVRAACEKVLGHPVRIYVTLSQEGAAAVPANSSAQERAKKDSAVEAFRRRFEGSVTDVTDLTRE
jgi:hypothetical protein